MDKTRSTAKLLRQYQKLHWFCTIHFALFFLNWPVPFEQIWKESRLMFSGNFMAKSTMLVVVYIVSVVEIYKDLHTMDTSDRLAIRAFCSGQLFFF